MVYAYDVLVIGGGPGGYVAAIRAAQEGKKTCIAESTYWGGTCLNVGCIPTKALIHSAEALNRLHHLKELGVVGVDISNAHIDMPVLKSRKDAIIKQLTGGVQGLLQANGVAIVKGHARLKDNHTIDVAAKTITAEHIIIATGSEPFIPKLIAREGKNNILTSTEALDMDHIPKSVVIIGGGVIGVEFAYLLNKLGSQVTVLELMDHILPMVDQEVSRIAQKQLEKDGIDFRLKAKVEKIKDDTVLFQIDGKRLGVRADAVLLSIGRIPQTEGLHAQDIGITFDRNAIVTDAQLRTSIPNIFAVGDVNGKSMLAHTASKEAEVAVQNICGNPVQMRYDRIPSCIYLDPEIACIGLTEIQAKEKYGGDIKVGRFHMRANGKSLIEGESNGMIKVILHKQYGEIVGAHIYGKHATDMIAEVAIAMQAEATAEELIDAIHPHPTVAEAIAEAFSVALTGKTVHSI